MAKTYTINLTEDHLKELSDDPEMDGITLEASAEDGSKIMVNLTKEDTISLDDTAMEEVPSSEEEAANAEVGNIAPEEQAAMNSTEMAQESIGFTNESTVHSFDKFLKTL